MSPRPGCGVCGAPRRPPFRAPAAELAPDLDGRPGEPARSTLPRWVERCRNCGASAPDLAIVPKQALAVISGPAYRDAEDCFVRWAMICEGLDRPADAAEAFLWAAWAADDAGQDATALRRLAAALWEGDALRRLDVMRRAGDFAAAEAFAVSLTGLDEHAERIVAFQRGLIRAGDARRGLISSALRPPAHNPHVAHGKRHAPGLLGRLFGPC